MIEPLTREKLELAGWVFGPIRPLTDLKPGDELELEGIHFDQLGKPLVQDHIGEGELIINWNFYSSVTNFSLEASFRNIITFRGIIPSPTGGHEPTFQNIYNYDPPLWYKTFVEIRRPPMTVPIKFTVESNSLKASQNDNEWGFQNAYWGASEYISLSVEKTFPNGNHYLYYSKDHLLFDNAQKECVLYASAIEYAEIKDQWIPPVPFFDTKELYQWMSPQQLDQFVKFYPDALTISYSNALGLIKSQIGALYDIDSEIKKESEVSKVIKWIIMVFTVYNISSPSFKRSQVLDENFLIAHNKLQELKTGASFASDAKLIDDKCSAWGTVVSSKAKMRG